MFNFDKFAQIGAGYGNIGLGGEASKPGGPANIPLNGMAQGENGQNFSPVENNQTGANTENVKSLLTEIATTKNPTKEQSASFKSAIGSMKSTVKDPEVAKKLDKLEWAIVSNSDPNRQTRNLTTGEPELLASDIAQDILDTVEEMADMQENVLNNNKNITTAAKAPKNEYTPKKKTRGNPFRVLMGQVGKLLDHGMSKRDIVKYLLRKKYWGEDMIAKAVDIVKDYNKKKKRKPGKKEASSFNLNRYAQMIDNNETEAANTIPFKSDNDAELTPDWEKRSTAELFARMQWLNSLRAYNSNEHRDTDEAANLKGAASQQKKIRTELKKRGFAAKEIG